MGVRNSLGNRPLLLLLLLLSGGVGASRQDKRNGELRLLLLGPYHTAG